MTITVCDMKSCGQTIKDRQLLHKIQLADKIYFFCKTCWEQFNKFISEELHPGESATKPAPAAQFDWTKFIQTNPPPVPITVGDSVIPWVTSPDITYKFEDIKYFVPDFKYSISTQGAPELNPPKIGVIYTEACDKESAYPQASCTIK
jgi:hypothetical protein